MANRLGNVYSNIRIISRPTNGGIAEARRDGFLAAQCDYVSYVDADDYIEDGALEEAYNALVETGSDLCVWQLWRSENNCTFEAIDLSKVPFPITGRKAAGLTLGHWSMPAWGVGKKEIYLKAYTGFSMISTNADELITRLAFLKCKKVISCKKKYYYVVNPQSTTQMFNPSRLTILDSDIWLLDFCKTNSFNEHGEVLRASMSHMWWIFRVRKKIGIAETRKKLRSFTLDVCFAPGFFPGILREGKPLLEFILIGLYCCIPLFHK
jgi:glycosyltransferase involved in cell wall biosynthesis